MNTMSTPSKQSQILQLVGQLKNLIEESPEITNDSPLTESALGQGFAEVEVMAHPLSRHHLADGDEHTRQHYATLLAAFLLTNGPLSHDVFRLFSMLLQSLNLAGQQVNIITHASRIQSADVVEYTRLAQKTPRLPQCLLMDALVIMRVDGNQLPKTWEDILNEWISVCKIDKEDINYCIIFSDFILGNKSIDCMEKSLPEKLKTIPIDREIKTTFAIRPDLLHSFEIQVQPGLTYKKFDTIYKINNDKLKSPENMIITSISLKQEGLTGHSTMLRLALAHREIPEIPQTIKYLPIHPELAAWGIELETIFKPS